MLKKILALGLIVAAPTFAIADEVDLKKGKKVFKKCAACHAVGDKAKNKVGPKLNGVVGRKAGTVEGFKYSQAMLDSGLTWDEVTLGEYLEDPKGKVPGNKMIFRGLKKEKQRKNLIGYLATFNEDGTTK